MILLVAAIFSVSGSLLRVSLISCILEPGHRLFHTSDKAPISLFWAASNILLVMYPFCIFCPIQAIGTTDVIKEISGSATSPLSFCVDLSTCCWITSEATSFVLNTFKKASTSKDA